MAARGKMKERNWRRSTGMILIIINSHYNCSSGGPATIDDISVFVIPVLPYKQEVLAAKTRELEEEEEEEGREAMEVEEERANKVIVNMEVEEEKVSTDAGEEVCDTKEEAVVNGEDKNKEIAEKEGEVSCDQTSQPLAQ